MRNSARSTHGTARDVFASHGAMSTMQAIRSGVHPATLYRMRDSGELIQLARGVYRLASLPPVTHPDLVAVASKSPKAVICLISALAYHGLTTQIPHEVSIALPPGLKGPRMSHPPIRVFHFSGQTMEAGRKTHKMDGIEVSVYNAEKTIADCFRLRNKIGEDVAIEALRIYVRRRGLNIDQLLKYSKICHVERVIQPFLAVLLS